MKTSRTKTYVSINYFHKVLRNFKIYGLFYYRYLYVCKYIACVLFLRTDPCPYCRAKIVSWESNIGILYRDVLLES